MAEPATPPAPPRRGNLTPQRILDVLRQYIRTPPEIKRTYLGSPGYLEAILDEGTGRILVTITVQR